MKNILQQQDKHFQWLIGDWLPTKHLPNGHCVKVFLFISFPPSRESSKGKSVMEKEFIKCGKPFL